MLLLVVLLLVGLTVELLLLELRLGLTVVLLFPSVAELLLVGLTVVFPSVAELLLVGLTVVAFLLVVLTFALRLVLLLETLSGRYTLTALLFTLVDLAERLFVLSNLRTVVVLPVVCSYSLTVGPL